MCMPAHMHRHAHRHACSLLYSKQPLSQPGHRSLEPTTSTTLGMSCRTNDWEAHLQDDADTIKLLATRGADCNRLMASGMTPLHHAVMNNKLEAARSLLQRGASPAAPHAHTHSCIELAEHLSLPEMLGLLTQTAIGASVDSALQASDQRRQVRCLADIHLAAEPVCVA